MNCLVLGGNGFIGHHLVERLLNEGHKVTVYDKYLDINKMRCQFEDDVKYIVRDLNEILYFYEEFEKADYVYHLISHIVPNSDSSPNLDLTRDVFPTIDVINLCVKHNCKLIFISSAGAVYGEYKGHVTEDSPTEPISSYGIVKLTIEKYIKLYHRTHGLEYVILRASNPYGPGQDPTKKHGLIPTLVYNTLNDIETTIYGDGTEYRDYIYIDSLINQIYNYSIGLKNCVRNCAHFFSTQTSEIIDIIERFTHKKAIIKYEERRKCDPKNVFIKTNHVSIPDKCTIYTGILKIIKSMKSEP